MKYTIDTAQCWGWQALLAWTVQLEVAITTISAPSLPLSASFYVVYSFEVELANQAAKKTASSIPVESRESGIFVKDLSEAGALPLAAAKVGLQRHTLSSTCKLLAVLAVPSLTSL